MARGICAEHDNRPTGEEARRRTVVKEAAAESLPYQSLSEDEAKAYAKIKYILGHTVWTRVVEFDGLLLAGDSVAQQPEGLAALHVTAVLNCAPSDVATDRSFFAAHGIKYFELAGLRDKETVDILAYWELARDIITVWRSKGERVLVYCASGINQSGFVITAYLMWDRRLSVHEAVKLVKEKREWLLTNETFQRALVRLAATSGLLRTPIPRPVLTPLHEDEEEDHEEAGVEEDELLSGIGEEEDEQ